MTDTPTPLNGGHGTPSTRRGPRGLMVTVAVLASSAVGFAAYRHEAAPPPTPEAGVPAPVPVVTAAVRTQDVPIVLTGAGTVDALNLATIRSRVTGYRQNADFTDGQFVKRRDVLARIAQTESALKGDLAAIDYAQSELDPTTLRAPFDGVTEICRVDIVNPTDTNGIVVLTQVQPIGVLFTLPTSDIAAVQAALSRDTLRTALAARRPARLPDVAEAR